MPSRLVDLVLGTLGFAIKIFTYLFYGDEILNIYFLMKSINCTPQNTAGSAASSRTGVWEPQNHVSPSVPGTLSPSERARARHRLEESPREGLGALRG